MKSKVKIEILGRGCRNCRAVELNIRAALAEVRVEATMARLADPRFIRRRGVTESPTIAIDDQIVSSGIVPSVEEVRGWLTCAHVI